MDFIGVDGCKNKWLSVTRLDGALKCDIHNDIDGLVRANPQAKRICIDIPIGLPSKVVPGRPCEALARKLLGKRSPSVFSVPSRAAVAEEDVLEARRKNLAEVGRSLSAQSFAICRKIVEVDHYLLRTEAARGLIREIHPEVCFWALAGGHPMVWSKKTNQGIEERLAVLESVLPDARPFFCRVADDWFRKDVALDDIVDAMVAYVTSAAGDVNIRTLCGDPPHDERGLPMEMLYPAIEWSKGKRPPC